MTENKDNTEETKGKIYLFSEKLKKYEDKLAEFFVDIGTRKRVNNNMLQLSSYLLIHGSLTQKELKKLTGLSMGTISTILSVMLGMGRLQKEKIPKTHTYRYSYYGDLAELTIRGIDVMMNSLTSMGVYLENKKKQLLDLKSLNKKGAEHLAQRIGELLEIFEFYKEVFPGFYKKTLPQT
ncbi:MAG: hypothetical protein ACFFA3_08440 [Promethearchaeota archaeon]